ncbi:MAG: Gfo/Idh/MocA family oxidoreductase [Arachnia sp.]
MSNFRVVGVGFDHMHIGDQLAVAMAHDGVEIVGAYDSPAHPHRAQEVLDSLGLDVPVFHDLDDLLAAVSPDLAFICVPTLDHAEVVTHLAAAGVHVIIEKPLSDSEAGARLIVDAAQTSRALVTVNWPLAWEPSHRTARRLIAEGMIGRVTEVHFYDGNRGPLHHGHGKIEFHPSTEDKAGSWWYDPSLGGGSMRDYLGYGTTLGTWFRDGEMPYAVTAASFVPEGLAVDEQSVVIGHYTDGLSVFETRWGTFTDPWTTQPQPKCGFIINGSAGSIASWDYEDEVTLHSQGGVQVIPADEIAPEDASALANVIAHLRDGRPLDQPLTLETTSAGHAIIEAAVRSAQTGRRIDL